VSRRPLLQLSLAALLCTGLPAPAPAEAEPVEISVPEGDRDPLRRITPEEARHTPGLFDSHDPWEGMNRRTYVFNARFDRYVFLPVIRGYEFVLPGLVRRGVSNVFDTIDDAVTFANTILQLRPKPAGATLGRIAVNLTVGVLGLWDAASRLGIPKHDEDFGLTLGRYGVPAGPYLVVPVMGPSSARDLPGRLIDRIPFALLGFPPWWTSPVEATSRRADQPFRYGEIGPPFEYDIVRFLFVEHRRLRLAE
jgi:phospholipid-binding lipoprotein MlaA